MWLKVRQFAEKYGISTSAVLQRIKINSIKHKRIKKLHYVWDDDQGVKQVQPADQVETSDDDKYNQAVLKKTQLENKLKQQKLKNLKEDTKLKSIRNKQNVQQLRRQFSQMIFDCFTQAFSDVKNVFIQMRLNKQQNQKLRQSFKKSIEKFRNALLKQLQNKDKIEDQDDKK